jgi:hypothetical protein
MACGCPKKGKWMLKRNGKQSIRKPIENLEDPSTPVSSDCSLRENSLDRLTTNSKKDTADRQYQDESTYRRRGKQSLV